MREIQKSFGFEFVPGVSRADMLENQVKKEVSPLKDGMTVDGWIKESVRQMKESQGPIKVSEPQNPFLKKIVQNSSKSGANAGPAQPVPSFKE